MTTRTDLVVKKVNFRPKMVTRMSFVAKKSSFRASKRRREVVSSLKRAISGSKWWRERVSPPKTSNFRLKVVTRKGLVVKKVSFQPQNGDENEFRRQNGAIFGSKWWREKVSSSKKWVFSPKMVTRMSFVAKMEQFSAQSGDEKRSRRQKSEFSAPKWWREWVSSPKWSNFRLKVVTRKGLVVKKWSFPPQNGDEKRSRRQKRAFSAPNWWRERVSSSKTSNFRLKVVTRKGLVVKIRCFSRQTGRAGLSSLFISYPFFRYSNGVISVFRLNSRLK